MATSCNASAQSRNASTPQHSVSASGTTVVSTGFSKGRATVTIETGKIDPAACPATRFLTETGDQPVSVVHNLRISVAGSPVAVPPAVYSGLFGLQSASLRYAKGVFILELSGGIGDYHIYFDAKNGVTRMTVYDFQASKMVEDAHFFQAVFE